RFYTTEKYRKKILLQDRAAVEAFSEIYFPFSEMDNVAKSINESWSYYGEKPKENFIRCTVYKKDGTIESLGTSDAISMQWNTSNISSYRTYTYLKKLAVPNLEPGDIVEYEYLTHQSGVGGVIDRIELADKYPILALEVSFEVPKWVIFEQKQLNTTSILSAPQNTFNDDKNFSLKLDSVNKYKEEMWTYESMDFPAIRYFARYYPPRFSAPLTMSATLQKIIARDFFYNKSIKENLFYAKKIKARIKKVRKKTDDEKTVIALAYNYFRYLVNTDAISGKLYDPLNQKQDGVSDPLFCSVLLTALSGSGIPCKQVCYVPKNKGTIQQAYSPYEFNYALKAGAKDSVYLFNFSNNSVYDQVPEDCSNIANYNFSSGKCYRKTRFHSILFFNPTFFVLPLVVYATESAVRSSKRKKDLLISQTPKQDFEKSIHSAEYEMNFENLPTEDKTDVKKTTTLTGCFKNDYHAVLLNPVTSREEDEKELNISVSKNTSPSIQKKTEKDLREKIKNIFNERAKELLKAELENDGYDVVDYKECKIKNSGRFSSKPEFITEENFSLSKIFNRPEENLFILNAGSILGEQITIKEADLERNNNIHFSFARKIKNSITIKIPAGFKAQNLSDFNFSVDNATGCFISTATQTENTIKIETTKIYKLDYVSKEDWNKMVEWLDAAYHFTQKKLFFRK
ncbi:MAG: DUF3857 domain-containing protein, partial [Bacteroidia bacterium]|nr:DUF3857 domain-containing protein [Bacteroidia bacterium]